MDFKTGFMTLVVAASTAIAGASMAKAGTVEGSVTYLQRIAVPEGAKLLVELRDVSLADAPSTLLTAQEHDLIGVPMEYTLNFSDSEIDERNTYSVSARITLDGKLLFISDTSYPVLTRGAGDTADLIVKPVAASAAVQGDLQMDNTQWTLVELNGALVDKGRDPGLSFSEGGQFSASGGCNRFIGQADLQGTEVSFPDNMAGTMMACVPGVDEQEQEFLAALANVTQLERQGPLLKMLADDGTVLMGLKLSH